MHGDEASYFPMPRCGTPVDGQRYRERIFRKLCTGSWCSHAHTLHLIFEGKVGKGFSDSRLSTAEPFMRTVTDSENSPLQKPSERLFVFTIQVKKINVKRIHM